MAVNTYDIGNPVQVYVKFSNAAGAPADPTNVTMKYMDPAGVETTKQCAGGLSQNGITFVSLGYYTYTITPALAGTWLYRWEGSGAVVATLDGQFIVTDSALKA